MKIESKLLAARLLTRSGDHAWEFAVPLALIQAFPGRLQVAALYYLLTKLLTLILTPWCGAWIDRTRRGLVVKGGIAVQFLGVALGSAVFYSLPLVVPKGNDGFFTAALSGILVLVIAGAFSSLGGLITEIAVGNDLVPSLIPETRLTHFNSKLRRVDLGTEMISPVLAGILFSVAPGGSYLIGLLIVALWNACSFFPEYLLLRSVLRDSALKEKEPAHTELSKTASGSFFQTLFSIKFKELRSEPILLLLISYALLWLSALSPHGVLLTGYLKDHAELPEFQIGVFRGLGAAFGLLSTLTFPFLAKKYGLLKSSSLHLGFQTCCLLAAAMVFAFDSDSAMYGFMALILFSRVGLYGFSNGEFELRQRLITPEQRGRLNSLGYILGTLATLTLFLLGSALPGTEDFRILIYFSVGAVAAGFGLFHLWIRKETPKV